MNYYELLRIIMNYYELLTFCKEIKTSYDILRLPRTSYAAKPAKQLSLAYSTYPPPGKPSLPVLAPCRVCFSESLPSGSQTGVLSESHEFPWDS